MTEILKARVRWADDFDNPPSLEILVDERPDWSEALYRRYPINHGQSLSTEQQAVVGGRNPAHEKPTPGWYAYIATAGPLLSMKTWGGTPDRGQAGGEIRLACDDCEATGMDPSDDDDCPTCNGQGWQPFVIKGGWHPGNDTARAAGLGAIDVSVFSDEGSWERGHTAYAGFALTDVVRAQLAIDHPEIVWDEPETPFDTTHPRWFGQPSKAEWRWLERKRILAERLWWAREHGGIDWYSLAWRVGGGYGRYNDTPWEPIRPYSELGPAGFDAHGRMDDPNLRSDWTTKDDHWIIGIKDEPVAATNEEDDDDVPF